MHSLYRSSTRGPEDDSVESKHVAPLLHYMFNFTTVVFDGTSPTFYKLLSLETGISSRIFRNSVLASLENTTGSDSV